ncbi:hypothetical protein LINGRAHAP2_LOCUS4018, partial [Linum grandiflorum]
KCGRIDHIKVNYPFTKKEKDKAFLAAWSASEDESEDSDGECISAYMEIATEEEHCDINNTNPETERDQELKMRTSELAPGVTFI